MSLPSRLSSALPAVVVLAALACTSASAGRTGSMADASADPDAISAWFDAHREHPRAILLLSPV